MRKLKLQMQMTIDGFVAGPNGEMDWMTWEWDDAIKQYVKDITAPVDTLVMGRKLAEGFIPTWASRAANPETAEDFAVKMVETPKVVFTKTLYQSPWERTDLANGDLTDEMKKLKTKDGSDIMVYGGAGFVSSLIHSKLIDEFHLFVNPAAIGNGMPIFKGMEKRQDLTLVTAQAFACGIVVLHYKLKKQL